MGGVHSCGVGSILLYIGWAPSGGSSPLHGGRINKTGLHREGSPSPHALLTMGNLA